MKTFFLQSLAFVTVVGVLVGCASNMSEEDKFLWNSSTNSSAVKP